MSERITISLPGDLVSEIDAVADQSGRSRSSVIREASAQYIAGARSADADAARREAVADTTAYLRELAGLPVMDDRPVLDVLRELRGPLDSDRGVPRSPATVPEESSTE